MKIQPSGGRRISQEISTGKIAVGAAGINSVQNLSMMALEDLIYGYNVVPTKYGTKVRAGYEEWATNCDDEVRTLIPYIGADSTKNRLFACTESNILDVTASTDAPATDQAFASSSVDSGYCSWTMFTTAADRFLCVCDEQNGYYTYTESTDTWAKITGAVTVADATKFAQVCSWKSKLWFTQKGTSKSWYLPTGSVVGAATEFDWGNKFVHGGTLVGLWSWTVDGGEGVDDYLVAVSSTGDVIVYKGTDPASSSTFGLVGKWFIGAPPKGRRCVGSFGGELYLLSSFGLLPISKLMSGQPVMDKNIAVTEKVAPLVTTEMNQLRETYGWEVRFAPSQNLLLISVPKNGSTPNIQFARDLNTQGWGIYRDIPYLTGDTWISDFYIGTSDGRVLVHTGTVDNRTLAVPDAYEDIEFSLLTSFHDYGDPNQKIVQLVRPVFIGAVVPSYYVATRFDYNLIEVTDIPPSVSFTGSAWDVGLWDEAIWGTDFVVSGVLYGGSGMGIVAAHAIRGNTNGECTIIRLDVFYTRGNFN